MAGKPFEGSIQFIIEAKRAVDLGPLSVQEKPELVLPRSTKVKVINYDVDQDDRIIVIRVEEVDRDAEVRRTHRFAPAE